MKRIHIGARPWAQGNTEGIQITDSAQNLTDGSGLVLLRALWDQLGIGGRIDAQTEAVDRRYRSSLFVETWVALLIYGGRSMSDLSSLAERGIAKLFGWRAVPDETTFGRWLRRGGDQMSQVLNDLIWDLVNVRWQQDGVPGALTLILDSTVVVRYGLKQEGAVKGYNPKKKGRPSHHPLLAFTDRGDCMGVIWRDGGAHTASGAIEWLRILVERLREAGVPEITVRLDKGFFSKEMVKALSDLDVRFVLKVPNHAWVRDALPAHRQSKTDSTIWTSVGELYGARLCSVERREPVTTEVGVTTYESEGAAHVLTNITKLTAVETWRLYNSGAVVEQRIEEMYQLSFGKTAVNDRGGNAVLAVLGGIAYQLTHILRTTTLRGNHRYSTPATLRGWLFRMPGKFVRHARRMTMQLQAGCLWQQELFRAVRAIGSLGGLPAAP